ncbi:MAG: SusD/RagB family nutrient-binding outer membrane lipoprotein [Bacteroidales bacterium]|nr:SusD/RagB family nutrient-binding outer membrane lipoprotein [Bacteroidales bacterium]HPM18607.1 SusD/RagB family nutrient-binding outer membrane lipoprotein [Bacteroidales bacterium]
MKIKYLLSTLFALLFVISSCDRDFEKINTNPILATDLDPLYLFTEAQRVADVSTYHYQGEIVQQIVTPYGGVLEGGNRNTVNDANSNAMFNTLYQSPVRNLVDALRKLEGNPARTNLYNMCRIWKAYCFQLLVDTYGDVPYTEAGLGFINANFLPKYDDQKAIYEDILKEYEQATDALDPAKDVVKEMFFNGDIAKWKKLGNSLLLRAGMRYTKLNPDKAKQIVEKAVNPSRGGVMSSNADNVYLQYNPTYSYGTGNMLNSTERHNYYVGEPFVDYLKSTNDPRARYILIKYEFPYNPLETAGATNNNLEDQQGMPYGYDENSISSAPGFPGKIGAAFAYSQYNRATVGKIDGRSWLVTYALTELLLAEACHRDFITTGTALSHYEAGIRAAMEQNNNLFGPAYAITPDEINDYLAQTEIAFDPAKALKQINEQYWVSSCMNWAENWANFRRSGYPQLSPINYRGEDPSVQTPSAGGFIHRLPYPLREKTVNTANVNAAATNIGGDNLGTRVFWDVQ